ncbi:MAG: hypothetical protein KDC42_03825 [Ignavibacteriae bacterium]|nr:hypothetical protein [Ignavibacteriota bacterium]
MKKEELLETYNRVKAELGRKPVYKEMLKLGGVTSHDIVRAFRTFGNLVKAGGDEPFIFEGKIYPEEVYYESYGKFLKEHGRIPTYSDWVYYDRKPTISAFLRRLKTKWSEMPYNFLTFAAGKKEWEEVIKLIPERSMEQTRACEAIDSELLDSIPPILYDITRLSFGDGDPAQFEKQCALALRVLGFEVHEMGSLAGRNPDGIARDARERFAVIYDAKSRKDYYTIGTDDRQFTEYILSHKKALDMQGFQTVFFLIISGRFGSMSPAPFQNVQLATGVTLSCITAENLLHIIANKILKPLTYDTAKIKELLITGGEVTKSNIVKVFKQ